MSSEVEHRLEGLLAEAPEPDPGAGEEALHRALHALRPVAPVHRGLRTAVLVLAAAVVLLVIAAGSLAAAGALHVSFGAKAKQRPAVTQLSLPTGANGITALVDGRLSLVTRDGFRLQVPASAAALSPNAVFVAAGIGKSLVVMAPNGRRAWSHPAGGTVVAIAWAPDAIRIAYVVRTGRHLALHVIWGTGIHDRTIDDSVRAVRPSWRANSLALAYVGAGGRAVVYDLEHRSRSLLAVAPPVTGVAFAPSADALAVVRPGSVYLVGQSHRRRIVAEDVTALGWLNGRLAAALPSSGSTVIRLFAYTGASRGSYTVHGVVVAVTPKRVVVRRGTKLVTGHTSVLTVPNGVTVHDLELG